MEKISRRLTHWLIFKEVIDIEESEIYIYGIFQMLVNAIDTISIILIAAFFHKIPEIISYLCFFCILRKYAGGYHAKKLSTCYILTIGTSIFAMQIIGAINIHLLELFVIWIMTGVIMFLMAPVECQNKQLDEIEQVVYRKRALIVWGMESIIMWLCYKLQFTKIVHTIFVSEFMVSISMLIEVMCSCDKNER